MSRARTLVLIVAALLLGAAAAIAQQDFSQVEIQSTPLADGVWMLQGSGGNVAMCAGRDAVLLIDDQYAPLSEKIRSAVASLSLQPIRFVFNTHWHPDHVGGNENFAIAGAVIVAHENTRRRLIAPQVGPRGPVEALPPRGWPSASFSDSMSFHLGGKTIEVYHVPPAHTDGDAVAWIPDANVIHAGDCFFNGMYPRIDARSGGRTDGMIAACDFMLRMANADTKIIPGHGPLGTRADLEAYRGMLVTVQGRVKKLLALKKTAEQIVAAKPTADLDAKWGQGSLKPDEFVANVVAGMQGGK